MPNYSKSSIYKICCLDCEIKEIYIGSSVNLKGRRRHHKLACNNEKSKAHNYPVYQFIRDNGGWSNFELIEIEKYEALDRNDLHKRERHWFETLGATLNKRVPGRTTSEYHQTDKYKEYKKEYRKDYNKLVVTCECGELVNKNSKTRHMKTNKHKDKVSSLQGL